MDVCVVDGWETFKGWTPYLMGIFVLIVWHLQKGKEVIANESKICIMDITEQISLINHIQNEFCLSLHQKTTYNYDQELKEVANLSIKVSRSLNFINFERNKIESKIIDDYFNNIAFFILDYEQTYKKVTYSEELEKKLFDQYAAIHTIGYKILISLNKIALYKLINTKACRCTAPHT